jgi:pimeloyl-ACP methyl ester carboxylesterase
MSAAAWSPPMPKLEGARHRRVRAGEVELHLAELGPEDGRPLLMVHGWPQNWWCWHRVAPALAADGIRCLMPDLRGHGWSDAPEHGYEKEQLVDDLLGLLDALALDRVDYAGHDWGGVCGFMLAFRAPERLRSLLVLSVPHFWPSRHDRLNPRRIAGFAYQLPLATVGGRLVHNGLTKRVLNAAGGRGNLPDEDLAVYESTMATTAGARATVGLYRTFLTRELLPIVRGRYARERLDMPARLVVGDRDIIIRGADLRGYERNAPGLEVERVPGARHFLPEERPELIADRARALLAAG